MEFVLRQKISTISRLISKAVENRERQKAWEAWITLYPYMNVPYPGNENPPLKFKPFEEFYDELVNVAVKEELSDEEIIAKFENIKKIHQGKA